MIRENADFRIINDAFPHIGQKLELEWGCATFNALIDDLQQDKRGGKRAGFPAAVLMSLFSLALEHDKAYPHLARPETDVWNPGNAR